MSSAPRARAGGVRSRWRRFWVGMHIRPFHIWWLGMALFTPSVILWIYFCPIYFQHAHFVPAFDRHGILNLYLTFAAAIVGFVAPLTCLLCLRNASARRTIRLFLIYLSGMLVWGAIDVRCEHYQVGGHRHSGLPDEVAHRGYWHLYFTWCLLPYRWIEKGIGD